MHLTLLTLTLLLLTFVLLNATIQTIRNTPDKQPVRLYIRSTKSKKLHH